jgi:hypothetical protein
LFNREAAIRVGGFNPSIFPSADYVFFARYHLQFGGMLLARELGTYRVSVNDSHRSAVLQQWIVQGLQLRYGLARRLGRCGWLLNRYADLCAIGTARRTQVYWNQQFDTVTALRAVNLPNVPVYFVLHLTGIALRMWFSLCGRR